MTGPVSFETARLTRRVAQPGDIDALGHVNNAVYVTWVQDAGVEHWFAVAPDAVKARVHWVCLRHEVDYREPVLEGEEVEVRTWLGRVSGPRFDRHVDVRKPGAKRFSCRAVTTWLMLESATGRPLRVGDDVLEAFGLVPSGHRV
ncbi:thioesterase family protein [Parvularcula dongshanensis]|uniref:Acyl-CoA thioester hydrolase n=1 Tax=Parvularcula dongshanensis TaxID=1173995 RepID=A0A840HYH5_9PROT|nr:acyl-CoA thioester hydrolase [Parvularcula dongshanensis]